MKLELVAPAKNLEQGTLALRCGADAVYVGGPRFGARKGAANGLRDLELLAKEARLWRARVYVTLNTILYEDELENARAAAWSAFEAGADALVIQDMAFLEMGLPSVPLHASTQAACDSPEKVAFLASVGFSRAILARELSLEQIGAVASAAEIELESFVYGALCVSESGHCYLSQAICGRSGNRGECAQPCRRDWSLRGADGRTIVKQRPILSVKDLNLSDELESLADAGVRSFKIEGRLKDADYVKNVVSHFRRRLDALMAKRPEFGRASSGRCHSGFEPDPSKTFQRGRTTYQLLGGARRPIGTGHSSGHLGEPVGRLVSKGGSRIALDRAAGLAPGDGLAFPGPSGRIKGTLVNAADGTQIDVQSPQALAGVKIGAEAYRSFDHAWHKRLRAAPVDRRAGVSAQLDFPAGRARLRLFDEDGFESEALERESCPPPQQKEAFLAVAEAALGRLGGTPFELTGCQVCPSGFLPVSRLNALRRLAVERLIQKRVSSRVSSGKKMASGPAKPLPATHLGHEWNVSNSLARAFYMRHGASSVEDAFELSPPRPGKLLMATRLCLRFELGWCHRHKNETPIKMAADPGGPLFLENGPVALRCEFDCERCVMEIYSESCGATDASCKF